MVTKLIAVVGTVNIDTTLIVKRVPDPGESVRAQDYVQSCGGKGANSAIASFRSSHVREVLPKDEGDDSAPQFVDRNAFEGSDEIKVKLIAAIGDDDNGKICRENIERNGIDTSGFQPVPHSMTGLSFCIVEEATGQNRVMSHRGANDLHKIEDYQQTTFLQGVDLLISHLALPLQIVEQILETAGKAKIEILLNAAPAQAFYRKIWKNLTHLIVNETEAGILSGRSASEVNIESCPKIAEIFLKKGVKNVVITLGENGAYFATRDANRTMIGGHVKAHVVDVKDTTGAGLVQSVFPLVAITDAHQGYVCWGICLALLTSEKSRALGYTRSGRTCKERILVDNWGDRRAGSNSLG